MKKSTHPASSQHFLFVNLNQDHIPSLTLTKCFPTKAFSSYFYFEKHQLWRVCRNARDKRFFIMLIKRCFKNKKGQMYLLMRVNWTVRISFMQQCTYISLTTNWAIVIQQNQSCFCGNMQWNPGSSWFSLCKQRAESL